MYSEVIKHCSSCPQCAIVNSSGRINKPPLHPIPVARVFQIVGVDIMDLPKTRRLTKDSPKTFIFVTHSPVENKIHSKIYCSSSEINGV